MLGGRLIHLHVRGPSGALRRADASRGAQRPAHSTTRPASRPPLLRRYQQAELQNGRWAMLGVAGMLLPELATRAGVFSAPAWFEAGKVSAETGSIPINTQLMIIVFAFHFVETKRAEDYKKPGSQVSARAVFGGGD